MSFLLFLACARSTGCNTRTASGINVIPTRILRDAEFVWHGEGIQAAWWQS